MICFIPLAFVLLPLLALARAGLITQKIQITNKHTCTGGTAQAIGAIALILSIIILAALLYAVYRANAS